MIKGVSFWSMKEGTSIADGLAIAKRLGFAGLELTIAPPGDGVELHTESTQADCEAIRESVHASGVVVETLASGMSWGVNPVSEDATVRERAASLNAAALERAAWLGCKSLLMVPGVVGCPFVPDEKVRPDVAMSRCREAVSRLLEVAARVEVELCLENVWNGMFLSPLELAGFIDAFASPWLGVYFDVGNLIGYHQHPPHWIELLGPRIKRVHIKDFKHEFGWQGSYSFCRLGEGDVPWPATMSALRSIGYDRTIIAEMMPHTDGLLEHTATAMDRILGIDE